jgi:hypothetical protein
VVLAISQRCAAEIPQSRRAPCCLVLFKPDATGALALNEHFESSKAHRFKSIACLYLLRSARSTVDMDKDVALAAGRMPSECQMPGGVCSPDASPSPPRGGQDLFSSTPFVELSVELWIVVWVVNAVIARMFFAAAANQISEYCVV